MKLPPTSAPEVAGRVGAASGYLDLNGNAIFYEVAGEGPPMIFLHDGLVHRLGFDEQFRCFSQDFTVVCYDRPGYGDSELPSIPYSHVETLRSLLESLGLETAILVGGSGGGGIAIVMVGESDIADNHAHAGVIELGIKGAKRIVVTDAGHLVYLERPEEFNRLVMEFMAENGLSRPE